MAVVFRSAAHALTPQQRLRHKCLYSSWEFHVLACSVWRIMYQQHEGELWPWVTSAGVEEIPSVSPAGTVSRLSPPWAAFSEGSLPWAGCQTWCPAEIPSNLHYSVVCAEIQWQLVATGRSSLLAAAVSRWSMFILGYFCMTSVQNRVRRY